MLPVYFSLKALPPALVSLVPSFEPSAFRKCISLSFGNVISPPVVRVPNIVAFPVAAAT